MRETNIRDVPPYEVKRVLRYYFPFEWGDKFGRMAWNNDSPILAEERQWVRENMIDQHVDIVYLFNTWIVNTTEEDDLVMLTLRYGQSVPF